MHDVLFDKRATPWNEIGNSVVNRANTLEVLQSAKLDWQVKSTPIYDQFNRPINGYLANVRTDNNQALGVVSKRYKIVQNQEAFDFIDAMVGEGLVFEKAGMVGNGKKVWITAKLPETAILGDKTIPYLVFVNTHDGKGSIRVMTTPIRVSCQNMINLALRKAERVWSVVHKGNMVEKLEEAKRTLLMVDEYNSELAIEAEMLANKTITPAIWNEIVKEILPLPMDLSSKKADNVRLLRTKLDYRFKNAPDLKDIRDTGWGAMLAISDFATHSEAIRETATFKEKLFDKSINGHPIIDEAYELLRVA